MPKVPSNQTSVAEWFFVKDNQWKDSYAVLRQLCGSENLKEELKWGCPCYTLEGKNIVLIHGFKDYCALLFMKGVLLDDPHQLLIQQTPNVQHARQFRFTSVEDIAKNKKQIVLFLKQAIQIEKAGIQPELKKTSEFAMPEEFEKALQSDPVLFESFSALSPGRQRAYLIYFSSAKQVKTREARIEKYLSQIKLGKGLDD